ncbi:AMP-binding protein, partial [Rubrivirga sp.]|uniref:AMP-binding protein n=1 Tax=Rubrivirga sp. TaxID=1885344 RepID=UPI003C7734F1
MFPFGQDVAWRPSRAHITGTNLARFWTERGLDDYAALEAWALEDVGRFWDAVLADLEVVFTVPYTTVLDASGGVERPRWCVGGRMNVVESCLDKWRGTQVWEQDALRYESEEGEPRTLTYAELHDAVEACAAGLRSLGLKAGDAVGLYLPMCPEIVVAFLAVARIGGVMLPLFSGYGVEAVATRLEDGDARALIVADGAPRRGRPVPMKETADSALEGVSSVEHVIVVPRLGLEVDMTERDVTWNDVMSRGGDGGLEDTAAEDTVMLIYTSGTTGTPKGAV